jgi:hypothetical protein
VPIEREDSSCLTDYGREDREDSAKAARNLEVEKLVSQIDE